MWDRGNNKNWLHEKKRDLEDLLIIMETFQPSTFFLEKPAKSKCNHFEWK